jgi:2,4-dienoyl-CoA reductase-like NADH-dependent reductase (Old Yellow Enzyme family)
MNTPAVNPIIGMLPMFIRTLALIAKDPDLGVKGAAVSSALTFTATAIERGFEARAAMHELNNLLQEVVAQGGEIDPQIWHDFKARHDAAEAIFNPPAVTDGKSE